MTSFQCSRFVRAPIDEVFAAATDFARAPERIPAILKVELLTTGPVAKGTRFRETRRVFGHEATEEMEVLGFDPPVAYVVGCESHGCRSRSEFRFASKDGGTEMALDLSVEPLTAAAKMMAAMMKPMISKMLSECSKDLDALAESIEKR